MMNDKVTIHPGEIETVWNYSRYHIGEWIEMYTTDKMMMRRYEKFAQKYPDHCKIVKEDKYSMTFTIDPKCMGTPRIPRKGPTLTEEQKQANRERLQRFRKGTNE